MNARRLRISSWAGAGVVALWIAACAWAPERDIERRISLARGGLEGDPAVEAQERAVEAALAREKGEVPIDSFEFRVRPTWDDGDVELRLTARVPVPNPLTQADREAVRRAETETALSRLAEVSLERRAELCLRSVESEVHEEKRRIYADYAMRQRALLAWNDEWRRSGTLNERAATHFEIEGRIKLATRKPGPVPRATPIYDALPPIDGGRGELVTSEELLRETVRRHSPSVAVHQAVAQRYAALSARAAGEGKPWFRFVDVIFSPVPWSGGEPEVGGQLGLTVPFGRQSRANVNRYEALRRSETSEGEFLVIEQVRRSHSALEELRYFESNAEQWRELLTLADSAQNVAERWKDERVARPSQVEALVDRAYDARVAVLEARERAGLARCAVFALTGVSPDDWPRE